MLQIGNNLGFIVENNISDIKDIGKLIKDTRKAQRLSQADLAGISGTGRRIICEVENGKTSISIGKLLLILKALGLTLFAANKRLNK